MKKENETRITVRFPSPLIATLKTFLPEDDRSLNSEMVHLMRQVQFPDVDADAYRGSRGTLGAMPRYTLPRPFGRRPRGGG